MMTTLKVWLDSTRKLFTSPFALAIFAVLYALLLGSLYGFIATREATLGQVFVTFVLMAVVPALFFIYQAAIIQHAREQRFRWPAIAIDALKFFLLTIPILLLGWLVYYLLHKLQLRYPPPAPPVSGSIAASKAPATYWPTLIFATIKFVLFAVLLPLTAIHLWIAFAGQELGSLFAGGAKPFFKRIGEAAGRAVGSESVLVYGIGLVIFVVIPYAILFAPVSVPGTKSDFSVFILRLVLTYAFTLIGWVITLSTLSRINSLPEPEPAPVPAANQAQASV